MAGKVTKLTEADYQKKQKELEYLKLVARKEVAVELKDARAQGDLSENAEYDAARDKKADIEQQIADLEDLLEHVEIVSTEELPEDQVNIGSVVTVLDMGDEDDDEEEIVFTIVSTTETDSLAGKISLESLMGQALNGKRAGDEFDVRGRQYKILKVER